MIDWKTKLCSRKFWLAVCTLVANLIIAFGGNQETAVQITGIITAASAVVAYIIGEGLADAAGAANAVMMYDEDDPPDEE